jgi:hypothetical protein
MFVFQNGAWGEKRGNKFIPLFTPDEYEFRLDAIKQLESGTMTVHEIVDLQQETVRRRQLSIYSQARKV